MLGDTSAPDPWNNGATGNRFLKQYYLIFYAQDEWKIRPNLTLNYGLRYEYYQPLHEDRNLFVLFNADTGQLACGTHPGCDLPNTTPWYQSSKMNFGPRLASDVVARRNSRTRPSSASAAAITMAPARPKTRCSRSIPTAPAARSPATSPGRSIRRRCWPATTSSIPNLGYQPRAYGNGYTLPEKVLSYTASVQQELPGEAVLTVAYVGSQGRNLFLRSWTNGIVGVTMNPTTGAGIPVLQFGTRFAQIDYKTSGGTDNYNSLQTTLNRRFSKGLTAGLQWTYGHSIGDTGGSNEAQTTQNPFNFGQDRGNNAFDVRHSANVSVLYQLPIKTKSKAGGHARGRLGSRRNLQCAHRSADRRHPLAAGHRVSDQRHQSVRAGADRHQRCRDDHGR